MFLHSSLLAFWRSGLRPSLVQGDTPRNAPSKTTPHRRYIVIPAVRLNQGGGCQPTKLSDILIGGCDEGLTKTDIVCGLVFTGELG